MVSKSNLIDAMFKYYKGDVKRINHFLKVYSFAKTIGEMENLDNEKQDILEIAAIVHDIGIKVSEQKYNSSSGKYQQIEGPPIAKDLMEQLNFSDSIVKRACFLVGHHHTYNVIDDIDFQILVEADFLVNVDEENMSKDAIIKVKNNYFKTNTGIDYLNLLYLV